MALQAAGGVASVGAPHGEGRRRVRALAGGGGCGRHPLDRLLGACGPGLRRLDARALAATRRLHRAVRALRCAGGAAAAVARRHIRRAEAPLRSNSRLLAARVQAHGLCRPPRCDGPGGRGRRGRRGAESEAVALGLVGCAHSARRPSASNLGDRTFVRGRGAREDLAAACRFVFRAPPGGSRRVGSTLGGLFRAGMRARRPGSHVLQSCLVRGRCGRALECPFGRALLKASGSISGLEPGALQRC
mmetsp:Transcript_32721/g.92215  ORF Transcript_32721/g.92215 Transcript_32721/m.92215 type:complete len:246 (-) Transcript_32721:407-1144(-)